VIVSISCDLKKDIELLLVRARPKLVAADSGNPETFSHLGREFGPIAHRVYFALDSPERSAKRYHDKETRRVMLDPWTVLNRARDCDGMTIDDQEFWCHCDMIKTLCDYLDLRRSTEGV
jgi:hypothetical protein